MDSSVDGPGFSSCENISNADVCSEAAAISSGEVVGASVSQDVCPRDEALRNSLILQNIFSHFKTKILLTSLSLVCKTWNRESRNFIHNYRKCGARKPPGSARMSNCQFLRELHELSCQIEQRGRPVPWNLLELCFEKLSDYAECLQYSMCEHEDEMDKNMVDRLKITYLKMYGAWNEADCVVHKPLSNLVRHASSQIRSLHIQCFFQLETLLRDWVPHFPLLEEIIIFPALFFVKAPSKQKEMLGRLLNDVPKLRRVFYFFSKHLEVVPEEMLGLIDFLALDFPDESIKDEDLYWKIAERKPALKTFIIYPPPRKFFPKFNTLLHQIFQGCCQNLRTIDVTSIHALGQVSLASLPNLSKLYVENQGGENLEEFWKTIASFDFCKKMPKLNDMEITLSVDDPMEGKIEWPKVTNQFPEDAIHSCPGIRKLTLIFSAIKMNISKLKAVFPYVTTLKLRAQSRTDGRFYDSDVVSLSDICEMYPELEELKIKGKADKLNSNYDAQFCGIFEEEAEMLREKDEEYLRTVNIVPIRPSVLTMPNLRMLWINLKFISAYDPKNPVLNRHIFASEVSEFVAFKRMTHAKVRVCGVVGVNDIDDVEDSDDDGDSSSDEDDTFGGSDSDM